MRRISLARILGLGHPAVLIGLAMVGHVEAQMPPEADAPKSEAKPEPKAKPAPAAKVSKPKVKPGDAMPMVMSSDALAKMRGKSATASRYDAEPDWSQIPSWRQASFFGIRAQGQLFLYVVDCSGSMDEADRLDRAKAELRRSVNALQSPQRFKVIFYNDRPVPMPGDLPRPADYPSKAQLSRWLPLVQAEGPTDPKASLAQALGFKPDAVFLLSDGDFPDGTVESISKLNPGKIPIHCVDLANGAAGEGLRRIAVESGGQYMARGR